MECLEKTVLNRIRLVSIGFVLQGDQIKSTYTKITGISHISKYRPFVPSRPKRTDNYGAGCGIILHTISYSCIIRDFIRDIKNGSCSLRGNQEKSQDRLVFNSPDLDNARS